MANSDAAFGLTPIRNGLGSPWHAGMAQPYYIASAYGTALYIGDPVIVTGDQNSTELDGFPAGALQRIEIATAAGGNYVSGVIVGLGVDWDNLTKPYWAASTTGARVVWVCDDPEAIFICQEDSDGAALTYASGSLNVDLVSGTGSTYTSKSAWELDSSTAATTNTLQMRLLRLHPSPDNALGNNAVWECKINLHTSRYTTGIS